MNAFAKLQQIAVKFNDKQLEESLERSKRYLKTRYSIHCSDPESVIASHSTKFALSDPKDKLLVSSVTLTNEICAECYELCNVLDNINKISVENSANEDTCYDIKTSISDIQNYINHLMRDAQQKKAKTAALQEIDDETTFWLKDFCQKILPVKFREGQRDYFGKKGMSLHVDVFFVKKNGQIIKHVYLTAVYRCDQGTSSVISIADAVLDQFIKDEPTVKYVFTKSDNAGCYHGNYSAESIYLLCKQKNLKLLRYDFNEPCCGKDQCDRESAAAKSILRSYVDAGNDIVTAEDLRQSLHYGFGMKDTMIGVAQVDNVLLDGPKIPGLSDYHSIEFQEDHMVMWKYYQIGEGIKQNYNNLTVNPAIKLLQPYSKTESILRLESGKRKGEKQREDRRLCTLLFCQELGCIQSFNTIAELNSHNESGVHTIAKEVSSFDKVKKIFVEKMKSTSQLHSHVSAATIETANADTTDRTWTYQRIFKDQGWALPIRSTFR